MNIQVIFLVILGIVSVVYLISLTFKPGLFQFILKGCLIPLVLAVYVFGGNIILAPVVLALVFGWAGDVLLVRISNIMWFRFGLASFLIGHICYCIAMFGFMHPINVPVLVISVIVALSFCFIAYRAVKPSKQMKIPVIAYEVIIMVMAVFAFQLFLVQINAGNVMFGALVFAGSICFVISDTLLALKTFRRVKIYFGVMVFYIAAQLLITLGFCMLV